jgi:hypothetical protein
MSISRQPQGIPVGGQFAATSHAESAVTLAPARPPELEGWPEHLPEPEVSFHFGEDNVITTNVEVDGETAFEVWNPGDDVHSTETSCFDMGWAETDADAAEGWAKKKHQEMAATLRAEMYSAVERARGRVLAKATGSSPQLSDEKLGELVGLNQSAAYAARRDGELAATAFISRGVLKDHPDASHIGLRIDSADNGEFVSGAVVYNAAHEKIGYYDADGMRLEDSEDYEGAPFSEHLAGLTAQPENAWWADYNMPGIDPDDAFTIDVAKAAAWAPGADA